MRVKGGNRAEEADVRGRLGHAGGAARGGGSRRRQASDGPDHVPRRVIDLPDQALARNAGVGFDSIAALSPGIPSHAEPGGGSCDKDVDLTSTIHGMAHIAALDTGICDNADIDHYTQGTQRYVVIAGAGDAAWTHINVTNPASPTVVAQYVWTRRAKATRSPDIKAFQQGSNRYVALSTEIGGNNSTCGLFIFDVTDPGNAVQLSRTLESGVWCSVHNAYVEVDGNGDGTHVYITANSSADLRVYSIANPAAPVKVGTYQRRCGASAARAPTTTSMSTTSPSRTAPCTPPTGRPGST